MKISLSIIICILTLFVYGQKPASFTVTLSGRQGYGRELPQLLDTVFLNSTASKNVRVYTNISTEDTLFVVTDVPIGKYWLLFSTTSFCVSPVPIVVCSKCDNQFQFSAFRKKQGDNCNLFAKVEILPSYVDGNKALLRDFQSSLSKAERKKLKQVKDFTLRFYLTKQGAISDPSVVSTGLPHEIEDILLKGLKNLTNWNPAVVNGKAADAEFLLTGRELLNK